MKSLNAVHPSVIQQTMIQQDSFANKLQGKNAGGNPIVIYDGTVSGSIKESPKKFQHISNQHSIRAGPQLISQKLVMQDMIIGNQIENGNNMNNLLSHMKTKEETSYLRSPGSSKKLNKGDQSTILEKNFYLTGTSKAIQSTNSSNAQSRAVVHHTSGISGSRHGSSQSKHYETRVKSAAPGGRSSIGNQKMIIAIYQDGSHQKTIDSQQDYDMSETKKGRSSRLFNQSFYQKPSSQTAGFEKIHHEESVKKMDKSTVDQADHAIISPYNDDLTLEMEGTGNNTSDSQIEFSHKKKRQSTTSMKKHRKKPQQLIQGMNQSQQQMIMDLIGVGNKLNPQQNPPGIFNMKPVESIFPSGPTYFNQNIMQNFKQPHHPQLKNTVFSSVLDHQQALKRYNYCAGGGFAPQQPTQGISSSQYHPPGGLYSYSASPQKQKGQRVTADSTRKGGGDIGQCLEIQRLESNRRDSTQNNKKLLPGQGPGGLLSQDSLKKPQTAGGGFRHTLVKGAALNQKHRQIVGRTNGQPVNVEKINSEKPNNSENKQPQTFGARMSVNGQYVEPSSQFSHIIPMTVPQTVNQSVVLLGGVMLKEATNSNTTREEAYNQFQEFKERFITDQQQLTTTKSQHRHQDSNEAVGGTQRKADNKVNNNREDETKFHKNLLNGKDSSQELRQKQGAKVTDHICKQNCTCQEQTPSNLVVSNLLRARIEMPQQTPYPHVLPGSKLEEPKKQSQVIQNGKQTVILARSSGIRTSIEHLSTKPEVQYDQMNIIMGQISHKNQRNTGNSNVGSAPSVSGSKASMEKLKHLPKDQVHVIDSRKNSVNTQLKKTTQQNEAMFPDIEKLNAQAISAEKSPKSHRSNNKATGESKNTTGLTAHLYDRKKKDEASEQKNIQILRSAPKHLRRSQNLKKAMVAYSKLSQLEQQLRQQQDPSNPLLQIQSKSNWADHLTTSKYYVSPEKLSPDGRAITTNQIESYQDGSKNSRQQSKLGDKSQQSFQSGVLGQAYPMLQIPLSVKNINEQSKNTTIVENRLNDSELIDEPFLMADETADNYEDREVQVLQERFSHIKKSRDNPLLQPVLSKSRGSRNAQQSSFQNDPINPYTGGNSQIRGQTGNPRGSILSTQTGQSIVKRSKMSQMQSEKTSPSKKKQNNMKGLVRIENKHKNHKINQVIHMANEFLIETFLRTNDQPVNVDRVKQICQNFFGIKLPRNFSIEPGSIKNKDFQIFAKEKILQRLYEIINQENSVPFDWINSQQQLVPRKFYVGKGNNYPLVRSILKQRWWWQLCQDGEDFSQCNLIWTSWRKNELIDYLKPIKPSDNIGLTNHDGKLRVYNRMEDNFHLSNKKALFFNMTQFYRQLGHDPFSFLPLTFHIEHGIQDPEFDKFKQYFYTLEEEKKMKQKMLDTKKRQYIKEKRKIEGYGSEDDNGSIGEEDEEYYLGDIEDVEEHFGVSVPKNIWIMKPGENSNRGNGIFVCSSLREIISEMNSSDKIDHTHIIQKYIEKPLLIHNRKFDIRVYGMLTSTFGNLKGYFYEDGYIRTSSVEFDLEDLSNRFIHLTNDAVQKKSDDYGRFENGNKVSYQNFQKYIDTHMPTEKRINFHRDILPQIRKIIADTFQATFFLLDPQRRAHTFEIFGYDFMIDANYKVYLIEANTNPCLELSCPLLARIIPAMLDSAFRICLDPLFPPKADTKKNANTLPELLPINKWELVFDERVEGEGLRQALKGLQAFNLKIDKNEECGDGGDESGEEIREGEDQMQGSQREGEGAVEDMKGGSPMMRHAKTAMGGTRIK